MAHGTRWVGLDAARVAALAALDVREQGDGTGRLAIVMGSAEIAVGISLTRLTIATEAWCGIGVPSGRVCAKQRGRLARQ